MPRAKTPRNGKAAKNVTPITEGLGADGKARETKTKKDSAPVDLNDEIRRRAYELYEERGRTPGGEYEDWILAEREILTRSNHQTA